MGFEEALQKERTSRVEIEQRFNEIEQKSQSAETQLAEARSEVQRKSLAVDEKEAKIAMLQKTQCALESKLKKSMVSAEEASNNAAALASKLALTHAKAEQTSEVNEREVEALKSQISMHMAAAEKNDQAYRELRAKLDEKTSEAAAVGFVERVHADARFS